MIDSHVIYPQLDQLLEIYKNTSLVTKKRGDKLLDYNRVRDLKSKGTLPDKIIRESAEDYIRINTQLTDELPKLLRLTNEYLGYIMLEIINIQSQLWKTMADDLRNYMFSGRGHIDIRPIDIMEEYHEAMQTTEVEFNKLMLFRSGYINSFGSSLDVSSTATPGQDVDGFYLRWDETLSTSGRGTRISRVGYDEGM